MFIAVPHPMNTPCIEIDRKQQFYSAKAMALHVQSEHPPQHPSPGQAAMGC